MITASILFVFVLLCISILLPPFAVASEGANDIEWFTLAMGLGGGLALFLAGLEQLSEGLKKAAGQTLKIMLARLTTNRIMGAVTGAAVTGILNSSSITTVLVVGFVTAGLMTLSQSVGVIMGANIGSTVTAQILAFNISKYALLPVAVGFFMIFTGKSEKIKHSGMMIMGMGMVFFGMSVMSSAMAPLRSYDPFLGFLKKMENPALGILAGAIFTGLVQSSAATVGIAIALASEGFLMLEAGIALALGANIGTCVTALLAAIGKPVEAVRAAVVHVIFNIVGVLLWISFIPYLASMAMAISPSSPGLDGGARMAAEVPRQIANANTIFNLANTCLFLPFTAFFAWIATRLVPDRKKPDEAGAEPIYLDEAVIEIPSLALLQVRQELSRISEIIYDMLETTRVALKSGNMQKLNALKRDDDTIDSLETACINYLSKIRRHQLTKQESREHQALMITTVALENLGDVIETKLAELSEQEIGVQYTRSPETSKLTEGLYIIVHDSLAFTRQVIRDNNMDAARQILDLEPHIKKLRHDLMVRKSERLGSDDGNAILLARIEISVASKLQRMYNLSRHIAAEMLAASGESEHASLPASKQIAY